MPSYNRSFLKEEERERFGRRLTHYLEDHTYRNKITHAEAAKKLGISANKFSQLKSGGEQGRFLTSLDYLKSLASLEGMSLPDFLNYIEGNDKEVSAKKYSWADKIIKALEPISISIRRKFADACTKASTEKNDRVELMCQLATAMADKDIEALRSMVDAIERMS